MRAATVIRLRSRDFVDKLFQLKTQNYDDYIGTVARRREEAEKLIQNVGRNFGLSCEYIFNPTL